LKTTNDEEEGGVTSRHDDYDEPRIELAMAALTFTLT
jgi:hypothetical protein